MGINVLVADDSATIQKVVSITLANESVNLTSCVDESSLMESIQDSTYQAILLDFGLSEDKTGFELVEAIRRNNSAIKILTMLPAFEQVDENRLSSIGSYATISKPFESAKFLNTFRSMIEAIDFGVESANNIIDDNLLEGEDSLNIGEINSDLIDQAEENPFNPDAWVAKSAVTEDITETIEEDEVERTDTDINVGFQDDLSLDTGGLENELSDSINDWGIEMPAPISNDHASGPSFPPIIGGPGEVAEEVDSELSMLVGSEANTTDLDIDSDPIIEETTTADVDESPALGQAEDDIDEWSMSTSILDDTSTSESDPFGEDSLSMSENEEVSLSEEPSLETEEFDESPISFEAEDEEEEETLLLPEDDDLAYPEMDLHSETDSKEDNTVQEADDIRFDDPSSVPAAARRQQFVDYDNLELSDSQEDENTERAARETHELEKEVESDLDPDNFWEEDQPSETPFSETPASTPAANPFEGIDIEKYFNDIKVELLERVDRVVREICEEKIEKVAWEVIPEVAENLIKKEIKSIDQGEEFR